MWSLSWPESRQRRSLSLFEACGSEATMTNRTWAADLSGL
jgi:hypothetical protein